MVSRNWVPLARQVIKHAPDLVANVVDGSISLENGAALAKAVNKAKH